VYQDKFIKVSTWFMRHWKMAGALQKPKGILFYSNSPHSIIKAIIFLDLKSISTCQYPLAKSSKVNYPTLLKLANISVYHGIRYWFFFMTLLIFLKLKHIHQLISFLSTVTIGIVQELIDFLIMPFLSSLSNFFLSQFLSF